MITQILSNFLVGRDLHFNCIKMKAMRFSFFQNRLFLITLHPRNYLLASGLIGNLEKSLFKHIEKAHSQLV